MEGGGQQLRWCYLDGWLALSSEFDVPIQLFYSSKSKERKKVKSCYLKDISTSHFCANLTEPLAIVI